ncbi:acetyl-CoA C-acetyltransferase [Amycolatopsis sp. K13G38]|uniref:Probable acetyl-CoA acetyltransferase n=1 Tax=Amycolatopsis acididurans TaxID=2724524 RepID=A0ABX1J067_9PSEU|nr:acetyl-CoA C-acetyltransferase [Amycolatopsis acididurans]NKQ51770.1 acetyl-CoA C-acetyltransferase [Amycolatopsis acididurans]
MQLRPALICSPLRTPVGRFGGVFARVSAADLASTVLRALLDRTGLDPAAVDDVVLGQAYPTSEAPALGRVVALDGGLGLRTGGLQLDRRCGSGLQAVLQAAMQVQTGISDLVIAGGAENMSDAPFYATGMRWGVKGSGVTLHDSLARGRVTAGGRNHPVAGGMLETAENLQREYGIDREEQDAFALRSQQRAAAAQAAGVFDEEIVPVTVRSRRGEQAVTVDEHPRPDTTAEALAKLTPVLGPEGTVTAGNSSGQNDGAALCVVCTPEMAKAQGLTPLVRLVTWAVSGVAPETMGIGPVPATATVLRRAGLDLADVDLIEINEAFAVQVLACLREWKLSDELDRVNVHGSGISLGHPVGATGGRILATLSREMTRRGARYGLETMCIGGGQGIAALFELAS